MLPRGSLAEQTGGAFWRAGWYELAMLTQIGAELAWISLWYSNLTQINHPVTFGKAYFILAGLYLFSYFLARVLNLERQRRILVRVIELAFLILGMWFCLAALLYWPVWHSPAVIIRNIISTFGEEKTIPAEFWVILAGLLVWSRGVASARSPISSDRNLARFQFGLLMFFLYAGVLPFLPLGTGLAVLAIYQFLGLVSICTARIYETGRLRGGKLSKLSWGWLAGICLAALALIGSGILPASLLAGAPAEFAVRYLLLGLSVIIGLGVLIALPLVMVVLIAFQTLSPWIGKLLAAIDFSQAAQELTNFSLFRGLNEIVNSTAVIKPVTLWGVLICVVLLIMAGLTWQAWSGRERELETDESLLSSANLFKNLRRRFILGRERSGRQRRLRRADELMNIARVRWIYFRLMQLCEQLGVPRPAAKTPLEYLPDLVQTFPEFQEELGRITRAYNRVRYGEAKAEEAEVAQLMADWQRVNKSGNARKRLRRRRGSDNT